MESSSRHEADGEGGILPLTARAAMYLASRGAWVTAVGLESWMAWVWVAEGLHRGVQLNLDMKFRIANSAAEPSSFTPWPVITSLTKSPPAFFIHCLLSR